MANTGQFAKVIVTAAGKDMIAKSQGGQILHFTRVSLGDGLVAPGEDPVNYTSVKNERLSVPIAKYNNLNNGQFEIQFRVSNQNVTEGFWHREIGIMAKIDNGTEELYAYTTAGNTASYIYDKTAPVDERVVNVTFVIGNALNLDVVIDNSVIYLTKRDYEQSMREHENNPEAHGNAMQTHNEDESAHADMVGATKNLNGKRGMVPAPPKGSQDLPLCGGATYKVLPVEGGGTGANNVAAAVKTLFGSSAVGSSTKSIYYDGATLKACADSIGGGGIVAALLGQNGYVKFANGLILQWGVYTDGKRNVTITLPIATSVTYAVLAVARTANSTGCTGSQNCQYVSNVTDKTFQAGSYDAGNGYAGFWWLSIGKA